MMPDDSRLDQKFAASAIRPPSGPARQPAPVPCANGCLNQGEPAAATIFHPDYGYDPQHALCGNCGDRLLKQRLGNER